MQVGDILHLEPTLEATSGLDTSTLASITARVIYIHPAGRYYTVEFRSPITGYNWREVLAETGTAAEELAGPAAF